MHRHSVTRLVASLTLLAILPACQTERLGVDLSREADVRTSEAAEHAEAIGRGVGRLEPWEIADGALGIAAEALTALVNGGVHAFEAIGSR